MQSVLLNRLEENWICQQWVVQQHCFKRRTTLQMTREVSERIVAILQTSPQIISDEQLLLIENL